jgi:hypothetical protein
LDDWAYEGLDKLDGFGLLRSLMKGTRPFTRIEVARLVKEALQTQEHYPERTSPFVEFLLERFKKEFGDELSILGGGQYTAPHTFIKPVNNMRVRYVYVDGQPREFVGFEGVGPGIDATEGTPLIQNNEGVVYGENHNFSLQFSSVLKFKDVFSGYFEPILLARQNEADLDGLDSYEVKLFKGYAKFSAWNFEIEGGRDSLWWGQGRHGNLLLTNHASPLDLIKFSNPTPSLLPWIFRWLGPVKAAVFFSRLESNRTVPRTKLAGGRFNMKPLPFFEVGFSGTILFEGEGRPNLSVSDWLEVLAFGNPKDSNGNDKTDGRFELDLRIRIPFLKGTEIYGEYGAEKPVLGDPAYLIGAYIPRLTSDGMTELRMEWAYNSVDDPEGNFWYGDNIYRSGYTYEALMIGHHMEGDAMDFFGRLTRHLNNDLRFGIDFDYMERGRSLSPNTEKNYQFGIDFTYGFARSLTIEGRYAYERVKDFNLMAGDDRDNHLFMTQLQWRL